MTIVESCLRTLIFGWISITLRERELPHSGRESARDTLLLTGARVILAHLPPLPKGRLRDARHQLERAPLGTQHRLRHDAQCVMHMLHWPFSYMHTSQHTPCLRAPKLVQVRMP